MIIKLILKFTVAFALLYWLFNSGKINFSLLSLSLEHKGPWTLCFALLLFNLAITGIRWKILLETKSTKKFSITEIVKLTWIGCFFSTILPGAVSGDIIKVVYARKIDQNLSKKFLFSSVFIDRILGLFSLLFLLGIFSAITYSKLNQISSALTYLIHLNLLIFFIFVIFLLSFFMPQKMMSIILNFIQKFPIVGNVAHQILAGIWEMGKDKKVLFSTIALSMVGQSANIFAFWSLTSPFFQYISEQTHTLSFSYAFTFIPLGMISMAIPITPSGLGVGHAIFDTLFRYFGVVNGASLFNIYFVAGLSINLLGVIPYFLNNNKLIPANKEEQEVLKNKTSERSSLC